MRGSNGVKEKYDSDGGNVTQNGEALTQPPTLDVVAAGLSTAARRGRRL
jgi:hypothetical protein